MTAPDTSGSGDVWEFEGFRFEPRNARLLRAGQSLHVEPKALSVLEVLLRNAGSLVERDALLDAVWGRVVVTPGTLTRLIAELRRTLQDNAEDARFIATVHTRGYRWIAEVRREGLAARRSSLPRPIGTLIGRDAELVDLDAMLEGNRLVTLAGPAGAGKTQLALEAARRRESRVGARALWVELDPCTDQTAVLRQMAQALDVREREQLPLESALALAIGERSLLVLLDNCEHVVTITAQLAANLLAACPQLTLLCTSRTTLELSDERVFWVGSLSLPSYTWIKSADPVGVLMESDAVRLFIERARAIAPGFSFNESIAPLVAEICRRLDGLPLALELAAARLAVLTPAQLLEGLDDRFALLSRRSSYADSRHRSLHAAIEWSYALLDPRERSLLDALGVLRGSWPLDAAQAVCADSALARLDAINLVQSLVTKSLISVERDGLEIRYRLLESVAAFALAQLRVDGREDATRERHAGYFIAIAMAADEALLGKEQLPWLKRLSREWPNVTAAWDFLRSNPAMTHRAIELASRLRWYFWIRGHYGEATQWCRQALEFPGEMDSAARARLLNGAAIFAIHHIRFEQSLAAAAEARELGERLALPFEFLFASLAERMAGYLGGTDRDELSASLEHDLAASKDPWLLGFAGIVRAYRALLAHEHASAVAILEPAIERLQTSGDMHLTMYGYVQLALQKFQLGDMLAAAKAYQFALKLSREIGNPRGATACFEGSSHIATQRGDFEFASTLMGAAAAGRDATGAPQGPQWFVLHDRVWSRVEMELGKERAAEIFSAGRNLVFEDVEVRLARYLDGIA